jgi:hypothetical protein
MPTRFSIATSAKPAGDAGDAADQRLLGEPQARAEVGHATPARR